MVLPVGAGESPRYAGTAFLYAKIQPDGSAIGFVVTNRHVIDAVSRSSENYVTLYVNLVQGGSTTIPLPSAAWTFHESEDVAVYMVDFPFTLQNLEFKRFIPDSMAMSRALIRDHSIAEGTDIVTVGFPMGYGSYASISYPFVRQGIVSQIQPWIDRNVNSIIIDANAYPGSSGSPVFVKRETENALGLLGILSGYIPYEEELISSQTGETMSVTRENSGLAHVIPVEFIEETIAEKMRR